MLNDEPWVVVLEQWKRSHDVRKSDLLSTNRIHRVLTTFNHYKSQHGFQLVSFTFKNNSDFIFLMISSILQIDIDFQKLFPNSVNGWKKLENLIPELTEFVSKKAVDPSAALLLKQLSAEGASTGMMKVIYY